jgi:hypothetical protein
VVAQWGVVAQWECGGSEGMEWLNRECGGSEVKSTADGTRLQTQQFRVRIRIPSQSPERKKLRLCIKNKISGWEASLPEKTKN